MTMGRKAMSKCKNREYRNIRKKKWYYVGIRNQLLDGNPVPEPFDLDDFAYLQELQWSTSRHIDRENPLIIAVGGYEGTVAHFHVFHTEEDFHRWENGACLMLLDNCYFDHATNCGRLTRDELEQTRAILNRTNRFQITNWKEVIVEWNACTCMPRIRTDLPMPDYDFDTINVYKENGKGKFYYER
jgi:hypothetical protein